MLRHTVLFPRGAGTLALFGSFLAFSLDAGLLKKFTAAQIGQNALLLYTFIEPPQ